MLQWMGGSRRKVASSRKSTQKRQKQYFEQRKRQQQWQQTSGVEPENQSSIQEHKKHRSLDILSLLNLSSTATEYTTLNSDDHVSDCPLLKDNTCIATPTDEQNAVLSDEKYLFIDECMNASNKQQEKTGDWKISCGQELSVLGLLDDDQPNVHSGQASRQEAHAAFSVSGLGKVEARTPVNSPPHASSLQPTAAWPPPKTKCTEFFLEDMGLEQGDLSAYGPFSDTLKLPSYSVRRVDSSQNIEELLFPAKYPLHLHNSKGKRHVDGEHLFDIDGRMENEWNARSSFLHGSGLEEVESWSNNLEKQDTQFKFQMDTKFSTCVASSGLDDWYTEKMDRFDILGSPSLSKDERLHGHDFITCDRSKYSYFDQQNWPGFRTEDTRNNLGLFRQNIEESCSSSAVRGEVSHDPPSNMKVRQGMRNRGSSSDKQERKPVNEIKDTSLSTLLEAEPVNYSGAYSEILTPDLCLFSIASEQPDCWPLETNSSKKPGCRCCQTGSTRSNNQCVLPVAELHIDAKLTFENISCTSPFECHLGKVAVRASQSHVLCNSSAVLDSGLPKSGVEFPLRHENSTALSGSGDGDCPNISEYSTAYCKKAKAVSGKAVQKISELVDFKGFCCNSEHPKLSGNPEAENSSGCCALLSSLNMGPQVPSYFCCNVKEHPNKKFDRSGNFDDSAENKA